MLQKAKDRLNEALAKTQYQLSELRKAKVVDAGAKGFVLFIQGILEYLRTGKAVRKSMMMRLSISRLMRNTIH